MNIVFAGDRNYLQGYLTCATSIILNTEQRCRFYFINRDFTAGDKRLLKALDGEVKFIEPDYVFDKSLRGWLEYSGRAAYDRLLISKVPEDKVIYIDGDVVVDGDLYPAYSSLDKIGAFVQEYWAMGNRDNLLAWHKGRPEFKKKEYYFGGFCILNLEMMRRDGVGEKLIEYVNKNNPPYADQDAINAIICQKYDIQVLPQEYTLMCGVVNAKISEDAKKAHRKAVVYHFAGENKPWINDIQPFYSKWLKYYEQSPKTKEIYILKSYKEAIDKHAVVSFDIFDTLVCRPFASPKDVFEYIGGKDFKERRIKAEERARIEKGECRLDDIYKNLPESSDKEIQAEIDICRPRLDMVNVFRYCKEKKKKIVFVSDMYLPKDVIEKILKKCGFTYDELFVSCEYGTGKAAGLFEKVIDSFGKDIVHFDDNASCVNRAVALGIEAIRVPRVKELLFQRYPRLRKLKVETLPVSHWIGLIANAPSMPYFEKFGYMYGVFNWAYMQWLRERSEKDGVQNLIFVMRDGYTLKRLYDRIKDTQRTELVYASRIMRKSGKDYSDYYGKLKLVGKSAVVDSITHAFSSQSLIKTDYGYYVTMKKKKLPSDSFDRVIPTRLNNWAVMEILMSAPEPHLADFTDRPVFAEGEEKTVGITSEIVKGIFGTPYLPIRFIYSDIYPIMNNFFDNLTEEDLIYFEEINFYSDVEHKKKVGILLNRLRK